MISYDNNIKLYIWESKQVDKNIQILQQKLRRTYIPTLTYFTNG